MSVIPEPLDLHNVPRTKQGPIDLEPPLLDWGWFQSLPSREICRHYDVCEKTLCDLVLGHSFYQPCYAESLIPIRANAASLLIGRRSGGCGGWRILDAARSLPFSTSGAWHGVDTFKARLGNSFLQDPVSAAVLDFVFSQDREESRRAFDWLRMRSSWATRGPVAAGSGYRNVISRAYKDLGLGPIYLVHGSGKWFWSSLVPFDRHSSPHVVDDAVSAGVSTEALCHAFRRMKLEENVPMELSAEHQDRYKAFEAKILAAKAREKEDSE